MPSVSKKQARTMAASCHNPEFAKRMKIPQSVACDFNRADTGKHMMTKKQMKQKMSRRKV